MSLNTYQNRLPQMADGVFIEPSAVLYGDIALGEDSSIWPLVAARGDVNFIRIGARTNVQDGSVLHVSRPGNGHPDGFPLIIGEDVTVGHKAMLHGCVIGDRVLVGMGAIILDGVVVEEDVIIGAGTLVPPGKRLESGHLYVGSPAKAARPLTDDERAFLKESAAHYVRLKNQYLEEHC
ncbi:gamma carbonic anhydrase family protein [Ferrimonas balearica]|uniref:gamma carbonic anhydrase family protein n=1 Tax=Ferrimonas balearica TaxID=44012 RepID=UPI001C99069B|nr:gamma carbonic anhydrase family protein [Ferrimonas balearica]MBY5923505.1 gamma carbonic anhydrase family protein [Ferrimonas balearica]MBY5997884.1 gamma carbonic anhydrase family protein [Ferrimonas balearica]